MNPEHAGHDETSIAGLAAADLDDRETAAARSLVASCPDCAQLHADLVAIMAATAALPAPRRTRDFQLTEADAARLRPSGWRRLVAGLARPRVALGRPLAGGLVALGIAGLIVSASPAIFQSAGSAETSGAAAAPISDQAGPQAGFSGAGSATDGGVPAPSAAASAAAPFLAGSSAPAASTVPETTPVYAGVASAGPNPIPAASSAPVAIVPAPIASDSSATKSASLVNAPGAAPSPLLIGSLVLLVAGLVLLGLTWARGRSTRP